MGEFIKIQFTNGNTLSGSYIGNFDNGTMEFDVSNHATGTIDRLCIDNVNAIERML